jgi:hypothetical protein
MSSLAFCLRKSELSPSAQVVYGFQFAVTWSVHKYLGPSGSTIYASALMFPKQDRAIFFKHYKLI